MSRRPAPRRSLRGTSQLRLRVALLVVAMVMSVFAVRLVQLQGLDTAALAAKAAANDATGVVTETLPARRGSITDRNGVPLAESVDGLMIVADPTLTHVHASAIARILARRLHLDYFDTLAELTTTGTHFRYVARRIPATTARRVVAVIDRRGYKGIDTRRDPVRFYPGHDVAANVVGIINDGTDRADGVVGGRGAEGAELMFDRLLSGTDGHASYEEGGGNRIPLGDNTEVAPVSGESLKLTIDRDVQWYTQRVLRNAVQGSRADSGAAVVMDSRNGQLLALADYPTFDAAHWRDAPQRLLGSPSLRGVYEPGSVEKVLTAASLIDARKISPRTRLAIPETLPVQDRVIHDYFDHDTPLLRLTMAGVIAKSSNIGTVMATRSLAAHRLWSYLRGFGLGRRTNLGVNGESAGVLSNWRDWQPVNKATIAFGQGVAVTAVQMAAAVNTVARHGVYISPSLVEGSARTNDGVEVGSDTAVQRRVVSARAARETTRMMEMVTSPGNTGSSAAIPGYRVAGKTGTAQRVGKECGCYDGTFAVSFAGFAPADDPRFLVYVVVQHPRNHGGGGSIGGPAFKSIMSYLLARYAVAPSGSPAPRLPLTWAPGRGSR